MVTSVSKREQEQTDAAAIYVVTAEEIKRAGVFSIPEALQLVLGLLVERMNGKIDATS